MSGRVPLHWIALKSSVRLWQSRQSAHHHFMHPGNHDIKFQWKNLEGGEVLHARQSWGCFSVPPPTPCLRLSFLGYSPACAAYQNTTQVEIIVMFRRRPASCIKGLPVHQIEQEIFPKLWSLRWTLDIFPFPPIDHPILDFALSPGHERVEI